MASYTTLTRYIKSYQKFGIDICLKCQQGNFVQVYQCTLTITYDISSREQVNMLNVARLVTSHLYFGRGKHLYKEADITYAFKFDCNE